MARPRSARAHANVLEAALELFAERGVDATSMDAIAEKSGVSKATIYKHWSDKEALCLEAVAHIYQQDLPAIDTGDVHADLVTALRYQPKQQRQELKARLWPHFQAHAMRNPDFAKAMRAKVLEPSHARLKSILRRGMEEGKLPPGLDLDLSVALLLGPMIYSHLQTLLKRPLPNDMPQSVVDAFWKAHAAGRQSENRKPSAGRR
jgi:AcrR family transcriptional regulator